MLGADRYTNEQVIRGVKVLWSIKRRPNLSLKEFETSFINKKFLAKVVLVSISEFSTANIIGILRLLFAAATNSDTAEIRLLFVPVGFSDDMIFLDRSLYTPSSPM